MNKKSKEQKKIDFALSKLKKWWIEHYPLCIFCLNLVTQQQIDNREADLCHKIRRSEAVEGYTRFELQTLKLNTGLGHRICHEIFDDNPEKAVELLGFNQIMCDIRAISQQTYDRLMNLLYNKNK